MPQIKVATMPLNATNKSCNNAELYLREAFTLAQLLHWPQCRWPGCRGWGNHTALVGGRSYQSRATTQRWPKAGHREQDRATTRRWL